MTRISMALGAACLVVLGTAGCDNDERLSAKEFRAKANAICAAGNERLDAAGEKLFDSGEPDVDGLRAFWLEVAEDIQGQVDDIRELEPPEDLARDVDKLLESAEDVLADVRRQADEDPAALLEAEDPFVDVNAQASDLGLADCADDGDDGEGSAAGEGNTLAISEREYEFDVECVVVAGNLSIAVSNEGSALHEIAMAKLTEGTTIDEVRAVAEKASGGEENPFEGLFEEDTRIDDLGGIQFPGTSYTISGSDVPAGDYALVCFLPNAEGAPHASLGMVAGFTIEEGESASAPEPDVTVTVTDDGLDGPSALDAGETTIAIVNDSSVNREINFIKVADGKTPADVDAWAKSASDGPPDPSTAPVEFFAFVFDAAQDRSITLELTPGQWAIEAPEPEKPFEGPFDKNPHLILFTVK